MLVKVLVFGQLKDIVGSDSITLADINSSDKLILHLQGKYPELVNMKYIIAVEKEVVTANTTLKDGNLVALLPPYAGG